MISLLPLVLNGLLVVCGAAVLVLGGSVLVMRRGRAYGLFIAAAVFLLMGSAMQNAFVALTQWQIAPVGATMGATWARVAVGLVVSSVTAMAWLAVLVPLMRPDAVLDDHLDGPLAEGGA